MMSSMYKMNLMYKMSSMYMMNLNYMDHNKDHCKLFHNFLHTKVYNFLHTKVSCYTLE